MASSFQEGRPVLRDAGAGAAQEPRSIGELLRDLANDTTRLVRDEIALARTEATDKAKQAGVAVGMMAAGAVLAIPALIFLLQTVVEALDAAGLPRWAATLIVGLVLAIGAFVLVKIGQGKLSASSLTPERTAQNLKRDASLVQEKVSS
jgi:hypothetical protein